MKMVAKEEKDRMKQEHSFGLRRDRKRIEWESEEGRNAGVWGAGKERRIRRERKRGEWVRTRRKRSRKGKEENQGKI